MPLIHDDFLLTTRAARRLYHDYAEGEPIYDYHTHLPVDEIARDQRHLGFGQLQAFKEMKKG